jgi:hypothetical protein
MPMYRRERRRARVRSLAGRGAAGESGEKRNCIFCFADLRAEDDRMFARASVLASDVSSMAVAPLEGIIAVLRELGLELRGKKVKMMLILERLILGLQILQYSYVIMKAV